MNPERVVHIVDTQPHEESQPQSPPDQNNVCGDLYQSLAAPGKPYEACPDLIHEVFKHHCLLPSTALSP
ncbi:hypothetical protein PMHK_12040 [Pseudomonas sp. MHK4]